MTRTSQHKWQLPITQQLNRISRVCTAARISSNANNGAGQGCLAVGPSGFCVFPPRAGEWITWYCSQLTTPRPLPLTHPIEMTKRCIITLRLDKLTRGGEDSANAWVVPISSLMNTTSDGNGRIPMGNTGKKYSQLALPHGYYGMVEQNPGSIPTRRSYALHVIPSPFQPTFLLIFTSHVHQGTKAHNTYIWKNIRGGRYWFFDPDIDTDNFLLLKVDTDIDNR